MSKSNKVKKVLKILKQLDTIWHPESTLVFKSQSDKKVTGRYVDEDFIELDDIALELCEEWGFKYDQELYNQIYKETDDVISDDVKTSDVETSDVTDVKISDVETSDVETSNFETSDVKISDETEDLKPSVEADDTGVDEKSDTTKPIWTRTEETIMKFQYHCDDFFNVYKSNVKNLEKQINDKNKELLIITEKYNSIKKKFDNIKHIFN